MKRVLVTGATGFIGSTAAAKLLGRGFEVHAVTSQPTARQMAKDICWHEMNLLDHSQTCDLLTNVKPSHLLHFAWFVEHGQFWSSPQNFRWVQASLDLLMAFQENGGERAVLAGTCAEYDWNYGYCREYLTPRNPASVYGKCKNALQDLMVAHAAQTGYSAAWGRIFFPFGPGERQQRLIPSVISSLLRGQTALCTHGEQIRDFLYVDDLADGFVSLLESNVVGPLNIASGIPIKIKEIVMQIARLMNAEHLVQLGALPSNADDPALLLADVTRLRDEVGWRPQHNLEAALAETIAWWQQRGVQNYG